MDETQRKAILRSVIEAHGPSQLSPSQFLSLARIDEPEEWALREVTIALHERSADDLELALLVGLRFGLDRRWTKKLIEVLDTTWSHSHEEAASALGSLEDPHAVPALLRMAYWVPDYLRFDEARTLAVKAIHSLGRIPGSEAEAALEQLRHHEDRWLRSSADRVQARRLERSL